MKNTRLHDKSHNRMQDGSHKAGWRGRAAVLIVALMLSACGGKEKEETEPVPTGMQETVTVTAAPASTGTPTPTPEPAPTEVPTPTPDLYEGKKQSMLTGEWIPEDAVEKRPFAVMLNNIKAANPQSGIGQADILYEALTEAGITRFLALFSKIGEDTPAAERLGSVRSARHYFVSIADEYDAIFVHYGETTYATKKMKALGIDHITGMYGVGVSSFYRDNTIKAPHNAFASLAGIRKAVEKAKFRTEYEEGYEAHFSFNKEFTVPQDGTGAVYVTVDFSDYMKPYFVYDEALGKYRRYQFGSEHIDYNLNEQLLFDNLIIWLVDQSNIDKNGYQTMAIEEAEGTGYYITAGKLQPITWKKSEKARFMRFYSADGQALVLNPGKTYVAVFPQRREAKLSVLDAIPMAE